jgi:hypothetical protein
LSDFHAPPADIQIDDFGIGVPQLLGKKYGGVSGPAARDEDSQGTLEGVFPLVAIVIYLREIILPSVEESLFFVLRISIRIGIGFILLANLLQVRSGCHIMFFSGFSLLATRCSGVRMHRFALARKLLDMPS